MKKWFSKIITLDIPGMEE